ncbi:MAG TPA: DUF2149 domain-containing protein [Methanosarcinales archaeon]|nr:DUF2149 domain-containing protein [Methanosarcinales archaeon]
MKPRREVSDEDEDPLSGVANLFDVAMIFAVGLLVMMMMYVNMPELLTSQDVTIVKNPGQEDMQIIIKNETEIEVLNMTDESVTTMGKLVASLYETEGGATVYVEEK